jgi:Tfp pilus assembly protein PilF
MTGSGLVISPEQIECLEILGHVYYRQGKPTEARTVFEGIQALDPGNRVALKHLAVLALERGDGATALRLLNAYALTQVGTEREAAVVLLRVRALRLIGRKPEADRMFKAWIGAPQA